VGAEPLKHIKGRNKYQNHVGIIRCKSSVTILDPSVGLRNVIENTVATISIPLTSTGHRAAVTKPSVHYNPFGQLYISMDQSHGVPVLHGRQELKNWLGSLT
jgi:hypothetical protein